MALRLLAAQWFVCSAQLRVAYLHQGLAIGGIETSIVNTCLYLDRTRIAPEVVLFGNGGDDLEALTQAALSANCSVVRFRVRSRQSDGSIECDPAYSFMNYPAILTL